MNARRIACVAMASCLVIFAGCHLGPDPAKRQHRRRGTGHVGRGDARRHGGSHQPRRPSRSTIVKNSQGPLGQSAVGRRDFIKLAAGAAAAMAALTPDEASAQDHPAWEARPKAGANRPVAIDVHTHWMPEVYAKAQTGMGRPERQSQPAGFRSRSTSQVDGRAWRSDARSHADRGGCSLAVRPRRSRARSLAQIINDAAIKAHAAFPDRFHRRLSRLPVPAISGHGLEGTEPRRRQAWHAGRAPAELH